MNLIAPGKYLCTKENGEFKFTNETKSFTLTSGHFLSNRRYKVTKDNLHGYVIQICHDEDIGTINVP